MKNLYRLLISLILLAATASLPAQTNILVWAEQAEKDNAVDITVIRNKNPQTGELTQDMRVIAFKESNKRLYDLLIEACKKDEKNAYRVISEKKDGQLQPQIYQFRQGEDNIQFLFDFPNEKQREKAKQREKECSISVTIIKSDAKSKKITTLDG